MYKWKKREDKKFFGLILFVVIVVGFVILIKSGGLQQPVQVPFSEGSIPDLSTTGFVKVDASAAVFGDSGFVSLTGGCYQLTANTEASQAQSISDGIDKKVGPRPGTHDLIKDIFDNLKIKVVMVKIVDLRNDTFYGRLILSGEDKILNLDSRPSDGIAIAVRTGAPIYIKEGLLAQQGKNIC